jgi:hypothetical protein
MQADTVTTAAMLSFSPAGDERNEIDEESRR